MRFAIALLLGALAVAAPKSKTQAGSKLDDFIAQSLAREDALAAASPGSLWVEDGRLTSLAIDIRASRVDDVVTIIVEERASAIATGNTKTARASSAKAKIDALAGVPRAVGPLPNLVGASSQSQLDGQGSTSRETTLRTVLAARVTHVLRNGLLVVEGTKSINVNSENQLVRIRGVIRPIDLTTGNAVSSDRIAELEVSVNGKGVVNDAVRRPRFLYRLLLGLLPF